MKKNSILLIVLSFFLLTALSSCIRLSPTQYYCYKSKELCRSKNFNNSCLKIKWISKNVFIKTFYDKQTFKPYAFDTIKIIHRKRYIRCEGKYIPWLSVEAFENKDTIYITNRSKAEIKRWSHTARYIPWEKIEHKGKTLYGFLACEQETGDCQGEVWVDTPIIYYFDPQQDVVGFRISNCPPVFLEEIDAPKKQGFSFFK